MLDEALADLRIRLAKAEDDGRHDDARIILAQIRELGLDTWPDDIPDQRHA